MKHFELYQIFQDTLLTTEPLLEPYLQAPPQGTLGERLAIYTEGFYGRMEETLLDDFGTLALFMEEQEFSALCKDYVACYPSYSYTLNDLGQNLSQFLQETPPYSEQPYLAEMAAYEWSEAQAFTAADAPLLTAIELQKISPELWPDLRFYLHPSCQLLPMQWNSATIIQTLRGGDQAPKPKKINSPQTLMLWRHQLDIKFCVLDELESTLLEAIKNKACFLELCDLLSQSMREEEIAPYLVKKLYAWLGEELLVTRG